jgi:hypothetical protein
MSDLKVGTEQRSSSSQNVESGGDVRKYRAFSAHVIDSDNSSVAVSRTQ